MARERGGNSSQRDKRESERPASARTPRTSRARRGASGVTPDTLESETQRHAEEKVTGPERQPALSDLLRKAVAAGLTSVFGPTEAVRRAVGDAMPRDWIDFATEQSERTRSQFLERLAAELAHTLETIDLVQIAERVLEGRTIELRARIRLAPREPADEAPASGSEPDTRAAGSRRRRQPLHFLVVDGDKEQ